MRFRLFFSFLACFALLFSLASAQVSTPPSYAEHKVREEISPGVFEDHFLVGLEKSQCSVPFVFGHSSPKEVDEWRLVGGPGECEIVGSGPFDVEVSCMVDFADERIRESGMCSLGGNLVGTLTLESKEADRPRENERCRFTDVFFNSKEWRDRFGVKQPHSRLAIEVDDGARVCASQVGNPFTGDNPGVDETRSTYVCSDGEFQKLASCESACKESVRGLSGDRTETLFSDGCEETGKADPSRTDGLAAKLKFRTNESDPDFIFYKAMIESERTGKIVWVDGYKCDPNIPCVRRVP